jgi:hypothetical protein
MASQIARLHLPEQPAEPVPDPVEQRLGQLIHHYARSRSPAIAQSVVRHIELLCDDPGFEGDCSERCSYLRMKAHWRWLAKHPSEPCQPAAEG